MAKYQHKPKPMINEKELKISMAQQIALSESYYNPRHPQSENYAKACSVAYQKTERLADYYIIRNKLRETYFGESFEDLDKKEMPF
jgi:hypothetical protein